MASPRIDAVDVTSHDFRVASWEELEQGPLPSLSTLSPSSSQPSSPVVSSAPRVDPSSSPPGIVAPAAPAKSLGELLMEIFEGDSDVESDSNQIQRRRLRRGDETSHWHPPLSEPPARHPVYNHKNHYDPTVPWDYSAEADISRLLDVQGDQPHRCFLVQWKGRPL
ncbi:hypothetical protein PR003_g9015 [Phytophthora rubi]|uniref:Uncharacterized protein n=1 Tax=Phytophthora rubi TaxID=129364 RepID=A0A6A4FJD1_9STRA|nr:hypothetical protein PR003_g9015 [Phytophthora rubi]